MTDSITKSALLGALAFLLEEALPGHSEPGSVFLDSGTGWRATLETVTHHQASTPTVPGGTTADILFFMGVLVLAGVLLEWAEISYIVLPLFLPYFVSQGVDMVWLAALICINMQTSFLTPPVGWSLFFFRSVAPAVVQTREIYRGVWPFIWIQLGAVLIVMLFPAIATWLPTAMGWMNK